MRDPTEHLVIILGTPRLLYRAILLVGFPVLGGLAVFGGLAASEFLEGAVALVFLPLFTHKLMKGGLPWRPTTVEGKVEQVAMRLGIDENVVDSGALVSYEGDYLDDPAALETYLPPSYEKIDEGVGFETWGSEELRSVVERRELTVRVLHFADDAAFRRSIQSNET